MPSIVVSSAVAGVTAFSTPINKISRIKFIEVDNQHTAAVTITINDIFMPTPSANNPSPTNVIKTRKVITVAAGGSYSERTDAAIEIIGLCQVVGSVDATACKITIAYDFE